VTTTADPAPRETAPPDPASDAPRPRPRARRHRLRFFAVVAVVVGAVVFLLAEGLSSSLAYFDTVPQALAHRATLGTTTFRLEGLVVPGSIRNTSTGTEFTVTGGGRRIHVDNTGSPPALFQPNVPVVAVGHFVGSGPDGIARFASNQILVKHTSDYIAAHPSRVTAPNGSSR
jgi:cytochrome c-type biogenesis protein CcmE